MKKKQTRRNKNITGQFIRYATVLEAIDPARLRKLIAELRKSAQRSRVSRRS